MYAAAIAGIAEAAAHGCGLQWAPRVESARVLKHRQRIHTMAVHAYRLRMMAADIACRQQRSTLYRNQLAPHARRPDVSTRDRTWRLLPAAWRIPNGHERSPAQSALSRYPAPTHAVPIIPRATVIWQPAPRIT